MRNQLSTALLMLLISGLYARAQATLTVLQTGGGQPLVSARQTLDLAGLSSPMVSFDFGFATDKVPAPGVFLDSFTVTLQDASSDTAALVTVDASGVNWAPFSPGAVVLTQSEIQFQPIQPPSASPVSGQGVAFAVQVPVPAQFSGNSLTAFFDLTDNLDPTTSALGWFRNVSVVSVPEPASGWLLVSAGLLFAAMKRRRG